MDRGKFRRTQKLRARRSDGNQRHSLWRVSNVERASYDPHHVVFRRLDDDAKLWRYIDITKLLSLLEDEALHFARLDQLHDPFEGSVPKSMLVAATELLNDYDGEPRPADDEFRVLMESVIRQKHDLRKAFRRWTWVSCWNQSKIESDLMWSRYNQPESAIAIQSTFGRLGASFGSTLRPLGPLERQAARESSVLSVFLGPVEYVDFENAGLGEPDSALLIPMLKRESFSQESEVRAMITGSPTGTSDLSGGIGNWSASTPPHRYVAVNLDTLIQTIFVSPVSPDWFFDLVLRVCKRYGVEDRVKRSPLAGEPLY